MLAFTLAIAALACLLIRGVQQAQTQSPGFQVYGVFVVSLAFPGQAYDQARGGAFVSELHAALTRTTASALSRWRTPFRSDLRGTSPASACRVRTSSSRT